MTERSIAPTYRGYRRQALYILSRLLTDVDSASRVYRPEGGEDLAVFDGIGQILEVVQVKDHSSPLATSDFKPASPDGFFARTHRRLTETPACKVWLATFGPLGQELDAAISGAGSQRGVVAAKVANMSPTLSRPDCERLLEGLNGRVVRLSEVQLRNDVARALAPTIAGAHGDTGIDLLLFWIFDASERQRAISRSALLQQIESIGAYLAALRDHSSEWHVSVAPLTAESLSPSDREGLRASYRQGVQATWRHILADLDSIRRDRLSEVHDNFLKHPVVVIRGASGQGKSSLALRYLRDHSADGLRFYVRFVDGRSHAIRIANSLRNHIAALGLRAIVLLDLAPSDSGWMELVKDLARAGVSTLVTVREEDFHRAGALAGDVALGEVALDSISRQEASAIYESLSRDSPDGTRLDFDDAWARFTAHDAGPLLEFTHIVTEGETLTRKVENQVRRLQQEASSEGVSVFTQPHLKLLALAATANESECRVDLAELCAVVRLDPLTRPLAVLEDEYLVRTTTNGAQTLIAPLHALRSQAILTALLHDSPGTWLRLARECLPLIVDADAERFLLSAFSRRPEHGQALEAFLHELTPRSWTHASAIARALLWEGINRYERENHQALEAAVAEHGEGWWVTCDSFLASTSTATSVARRTIATILKQREDELPQTVLTAKDRAFAPFRRWASCVSPPTAAPTATSDWLGLADVAFWLAHQKIGEQLQAAIREVNPDDSLNHLSIGEAADFIAGRYALGDESFRAWLRTSRPALSARFVRDTGSLAVIDTDGDITVLFPVGLADDSSAPAADAHDFHAQALKRVTLLRQLYPDKAVIRSEGIGHDVLAALIPRDETVKAIPAENLPLRREVELNAAFRNLVGYRLLRSTSWRVYAEGILTFRRTVCEAFRGLARGWGRFVEHQRIRPADFRAMPGIALTKLQASRIKMFPQSAVDEWGFVSEDAREDTPMGQAAAEAQLWGNIRRFADWRKHWNEYEPCVGRVGQWVLEASVVHLGKKNLSEGGPEESESGRLLVVNLAFAWRSLAGMQAEFRRWFAKYIPEARLAELEGHERSTFSHLWPVAFGLVHSNDVAASADLAWELRERRYRFLHDLRRELGVALGTSGGRFTILERPYDVSGKACLVIVCDHDRLAAVEAARPAVVQAAWRATQFREWQAFEATPLETEWPQLLIVHTVRGKAVTRAGSFVSTQVLFGSRAEIKVAPHHLWAMPVNLDHLRVATWDSPLVVATIEYQARMGLFTLAMARFWSIAEAAARHGLDDATLEGPLEVYFGELSKLRQKAVGAFEELISLLRGRMASADAGGDDLSQHLSSLEEVGKPLLMLDADRSVTMSLDKFSEWARYVIEHTHDLTALLTETLDACLA